MSKANDVVTLLDNALKLMNANGKHWFKGNFQGPDTPDGEPTYCTLGALNIAAGPDPRATPFVPARYDAENALEASIPYDDFDQDDADAAEITDIASYNDAYNTTWADMQAWFERAKDYARREYRDDA